MDQQGILLQPLPLPGAVTSFHAYEGGAARNAVMAALALQLAGTQDATPVLVIDWDLAAPALHRHFALPADEPSGSAFAPASAQFQSPQFQSPQFQAPQFQPPQFQAPQFQAQYPPPQFPPHRDAQASGDDTGEQARPGLLEFFEACRARLRSTAGRGEELAERVIDAVGWQAYIERADGRRPVYLLRAGRFDGNYAERAGRLDHEALFDACPALFRCFAARLAQHFGHVLVAAGAGRSAAVSVCTTLVPDRLVGLFTPAPGSIEGIEGVLRRAIDYRCTHEEEQRPLLFYPLACTADGARSDPQARWRRGDVRHGLPGYQPRFEALLRASYGWSQVNLDSWFDETQLALADALSTAGPAGDRRALARHAALLAEWLAPGRFPWQSLAEVRLRAALAQARRMANGDEIGSPPLAEHLALLGQLCRRERRRDEARACLQESLALRERLLGDEHPATRAGRAALAALLLENGDLHDARRHYDLLVQACMRKAGPDDPETLAARSQLARALAGLGEGERALALHEQVVSTCERALGAEHLVTLDCLEDLAHSLVQQREFERARIVHERVLDARRRGQGGEHADTLRCGQRLALLLGETGELGNARRMLESVLRAHERHDGPDAAGTLAAREALAEILAAQGDLAAVRSIQESLARTRERHLGACHPETLNMQLRLASTLGQQGEAEAARRLRERVAELRQHLREVEGVEGVEGAPAIGAGQGDGAGAPFDAVAAGLSPGGAVRGLSPSSSPAEQGDAAHSVRIAHEHAATGRHAEAGHAADNLGQKLTQLQNLIDNRSPGEARALADSLRTSVLRPSAAHPLRRRGAAMIKQVYLQEGDKDALLSFTQDEVSLLEGALIEAARDHSMAMR
ncbi:tetratricopeptide repeat protein [Massilia sp. HP4]|uniref:tetratricopeptide repeat protein n=1 Tax=Massilia sp. HP4 TaxID=2562316 RepID=UPI0010BF6EC6|nr:tetratricopeptide repeat protein [Massilia sp. HP4]